LGGLLAAFRDIMLPYDDGRVPTLAKVLRAK